MKKNLALILALVMLMSTFFGVIPMAEGETTEAPSTPVVVEYEPEISFANIQYSDKMNMMFAVPAPTALGEGESVKLIVWDDKGNTQTGSFKDQIKTVLEAAPAKATIGGAEYLVFTYDALTAADMGKIITARPVVTKTTVTETASEEVAVTYGDIVEYSVLEYVASAKGEFDGIPALENAEHIKLLESMVDFGALAQKYSGKQYDFVVSNSLEKLWYLPVINGVAQAPVFGGFFEAGEGKTVTVSAPIYADYSFLGYFDAAGAELTDADGYSGNGIQVAAPAEGDCTVTVKFGLKYTSRVDANLATVSSVNSRDNGTTNNYNPGQGAMGINTGAGSDSGLNFSGFDIIDDPYQTGNKVFQVYGTTGFTLSIGNTIDEYKANAKPSAVDGFNDTIDPIVTIDLTIARGPDGSLFRTNTLRFRSASAGYTKFAKLTREGVFQLYVDNNGTTVDLPVKVAEKGYTRYSLVFDFENEVIYAYAAEHAEDELVFQTAVKTTWTQTGHDGKPWIEWAMTMDRVEWIANAEAMGSDDPTELTKPMADLDGDGTPETPVVMADGNTNVDALKWAVRNTRSTLIKEFCAYVGSPVAEFPELLPEPPHEHEFVDGKCACGESDPNYVPAFTAEQAQALYRQYRALLVKDWDSYIGYAGQSVFEMYNVNANDANVDSKNSQLQATNFGDEHLTKYYGDGSWTFGGIGINTSAPVATDVFSYAGVDVIDDPYQTGNKVYSFNGNLPAVLWQADQIKNAGIRPAYTQALKISARAADQFAATPVITYDMVLGGNGYTRMLETDTLRFRGGSNVFVHLFKIAADGSILACASNETYTDSTFVDTNANVKLNGYTRVVAEVDCANKTFKIYVADEGAELQCVYTSSALWITTTGLSQSTEGSAVSPATAYKDDWMTMASKLDRTEFMMASGAANALADAELGVHEHKYVDGKCECGAKDPTYVTKEQAQELYRQYRALLFKDWDSYIGYAGQSVFEMYNVNANDANVASKNSQLQGTNFGDEHLKNHYGEGSWTFGGIGINTSAPVAGNNLSYAGVDVIDDPYQTGNKVYSFNGSLGAVLWQADQIKNAGTRPAYTQALKISTRAPEQFATTPVITYDMVLGGNGYSRMLETDTVRFRGGSNVYVHLFKITADGSILACAPNETYTDSTFVDTNANVKLNGYTRVVAEVDCANKTFKIYAADEGAELQCVYTSSALWITSTALSHNVEGSSVSPISDYNADWMTMASKLDRTEIMMATEGLNTLTAEEIASANKSEG